MTFEKLTKDVLLYDIYDNDVVTLKFVDYLDFQYAIFVSVEHNKPITIYRERILQLYENKIDAYNDLLSLLKSKIVVIEALKDLECS